MKAPKTAKPAACSGCKHYVAMPGHGKDKDGNPVVVGNCYRYPPQFIVSGASAFPVVVENGHPCGEFAKT